MMQLHRIAALSSAFALACASGPPPTPTPLAVSSEADSSSRIVCEAVVRQAASAGQKVYKQKEVDSAASLIWTGHGPKHPGKNGVVKMQVVIDSTGTPDLATLRPVEPVDPVLYQSVLTFMESARYNPAHVGTHPVTECLVFTAEFRDGGSMTTSAKLPPVYPRPSF